MTENSLPYIGWREWVALPQLGIARLKVKVDTGARTSALHAFYVEPFEEDGRARVRFGLHPEQGNTTRHIDCVCDVHDVRWVTDSGGNRERRVVIIAPIVLAGMSWPIEMTLTDRDTMRFRMLLGRSAIVGRFLIDPQASYLQGRPSRVPRRRPRRALEGAQ